MTTNDAPPPVNDEGLNLPGLDGSNPLGFLAALGLVRALGQGSGHCPVHIKWLPLDGTWIPSVKLRSEQPFDQDALLDVLKRVLVRDIDGHPARLLREVRIEERHARRNFFCRRLDQTARNARTDADWLAAVASDFAPDDAVNQLQTARRDYYYDNLTSIIKLTEVRHLRRAIFERWDYGDPLDNQSLHLDPSEDRRHAYQWNKPAGDPDRGKSGGMLGANRLAIEAIPLFTSFPERDTLHTVGFVGNRSNDTRWTWPIWNMWLASASLPSLLSLPDLQVPTPDAQQRHELHQRGIAAVFRSDRILVQKTPNFTPSRRIA
jgi:hypothetical protein